MYNKKIIKTPKAPKAIGAYSQGTIFNNLIFTSGQIPININDNVLISEDFREQTYHTLKNLKNLIESEGSNINKILKITVYLIDLTNFEILNEVIEDFFGTNFPARSVVQVVKLPKDSQIEIEAICIK